MKIVALSLILSFQLVLTACVPSLNPLYMEQDVMTDNSLVGVWSENDGRETWTLSYCDKASAYSLVHTDERGKNGHFTARLVKVGDKTFLDIVPVDPGFSQTDFYQGHFFSTHTFALLIKNGPSVTLSILEPGWLKSFVAENTGAIGHLKIRDVIVLTSSPKETQAFLLSHLNTAGAFSKSVELKRRRNR